MRAHPWREARRRRAGVGRGAIRSGDASAAQQQTPSSLPRTIDFIRILSVLSLSHICLRASGFSLDGEMDRAAADAVLLFGFGRV